MENKIAGQGLAPAVKKALSLLLAIIMLFSITAGIDLSAYAVLTSEGYEYESNGVGTVCITGYSGYIGSKAYLSIPSQLDGKTVTSIGASAFKDSTVLKEVSIPSSVTRIGIAAFYNCTNLESIILPDSITNMEQIAFYNTAYYNNKSNWNNGVLYIGNYLIKSEESISGTYSIKNGTITIAECAFSGCTNLTKIIMPNSVTSVGEFAFGNCDSLKSVTIGNKVTNIGYRAFYYCTDLESITIPNSVTYIGESAFSNCTNLASVAISSNIKVINSGTFSSCESVKSITIPNSVNRIDSFAFQDCISLTEITIPNSVTNIGERAFGWCQSLRNVIIPKNVTNIDDEAFRDCSENFTISCYYNSYAQKYAEENYIDYKFISNEGIEKINSFETKNISSLKIYEENYLYFIPTESGKYRFYSMDSDSVYIICNIYDSDMHYVESIYDQDEWCYYYPLEKGKTYYLVSYYTSGPATASYSVTIEQMHNCQYINGVCKICSDTQYEYEILSNGTAKITSYWGLQSELTIPSRISGYTVSSIGEFAFSECESLTNVIIPNTVSSIGTLAFQGCSNLKSITIPDSVKEIGDYAFVDCSKLTNITIPSKITKLNDGVFQGCSSLKNLTIPNTVTSIGDLAFAGCTNLTSITIPNNVTKIGQEAFAGCKNLTSIVIPNNVVSLDQWVFYDCKNLKSITIKNKNTTIGKECIPKSVTIYGYKDSTAEAYAKKYGNKFSSIGGTHTHTYKTTTTKATTKKNGSKVTKCTVCGSKKSSTTIYYPKTITLSITSYTYNGKAKKPSVTVKDSKGKKIAASNYTVSYQSGRKNVGTYTVTIKFKGNFSGTVKKTFTIKPKATTLSSVTAGKKMFTAKWKKQTTQITGYQIQYSTDKNFKKNNKSVTISKNKTTSKSVSKLKAKKKYYVRVRTYKTVKVNGKSTKIYSAWSKSKVVTTKK